MTVPDFSGYFLSDDSLLIGALGKEWALSTGLRQSCRDAAEEFQPTAPLRMSTLSLGVLVTHSNFIPDFSLFFPARLSSVLIFVCTMLSHFSHEEQQ